MLTVKPALQGNAALFKQYSAPNATADWITGCFLQLPSLSQVPPEIFENQSKIQRTTGVWVVPQKCLKNKNTRHAHLKSRILVTPSVFCFLTCVTLVISTLKLARCGDKSQQQETSYMTIKIWKEFRALQSKRSLHTAVCFQWKPSWARTVASEHSRFNISTSYERF